MRREEKDKVQTKKARRGDKKESPTPTGDDAPEAPERDSSEEADAPAEPSSAVDPDASPDDEAPPPEAVAPGAGGSDANTEDLSKITVAVAVVQPPQPAPAAQPAAARDAAPDLAVTTELPGEKRSKSVAKQPGSLAAKPQNARPQDASTSDHMATHKYGADVPAESEPVNAPEAAKGAAPNAAPAARQLHGKESHGQPAAVALDAAENAAAAAPQNFPPVELLPAADTSIPKEISAQAHEGAPKGAANDAEAPVVNLSGAHESKKLGGTEGAESAGAAQESARPDPADPLDQIVLGLKGKLDARTGKAEIRLDPPNLGAVRVSVTLENGALTAEFHSSSDVVRDLLKGNFEKLKTVLQDQGVAVDRLAVASPEAPAANGQGQQNSSGSPAHDGRSAGHYQQDSRQRRPESDAFARVLRQAGEAPIDLVA